MSNVVQTSDLLLYHNLNIIATPPAQNVWYEDETTQIKTYRQSCMTFIYKNLCFINLKQQTLKLKQDALFCPPISLKENWSCYAESITYDTNVLTPNRLKMHEIKIFENSLITFLSFNHLFMFFLPTIIHLFRSTKHNKIFVYELILQCLWGWIHFKISLNIFCSNLFPINNRLWLCNNYCH